MKLICDDKIQVYFWVDDQNEDKLISPHFDYVEDAVDWYQRTRDGTYEKLAKSWTKTTE